MQNLLQNGEKITPKQWKAEIQSLQSEYDSIGKEQTKTAAELAYAEVIGYNKKNLERDLQNESDSRTGNWYLLFSTYQILYSFCEMLYNSHKERDSYEYEYYIEILTVIA